MGYIESVLLSTGGHAAPVENLDYELELDEADLLDLELIGEKEYELLYSDDEEEDEYGIALAATAGSKPAPKKDQIKGSEKNRKGSASTGAKVDFSEKVTKSLQRKVEEHNEKHGDTASKKTSLKTLKAVYRRGAGAFSTSHRPDQNRNSWAMARVNAFLHLLRTGNPKNSKYTTDNDLLPAAHRRSTKKESSAMTAAGEYAADPCWDGYVQVGMKDKDGKRVPNCVPSAATIEFIVNSANSEFGASRHVDLETAYAVARKACDKYEYLPDEELYSAIMWELQSFVEYATSGAYEDDEMSEYVDHLPEGHPDRADSLVASLVWLSGAPELTNSARETILAAFGDSADYVSALHASTRLKVLISSGSLSEPTTLRLKTIAERYSKVD